MIVFKLFIGVFLSIHKTSHTQKKLFLDHYLIKYLNNAKNSIFWDFILLNPLKSGWIRRLKADKIFAPYGQNWMKSSASDDKLQNNFEILPNSSWLI